jgi:hypothetical protein
MITNSQFQYCSKCGDESHQSERAKSLVRIGDEVSVSDRFDVTTYTFFQCSDCGHLWQRLIDRGRGGHGLFYTRLTRH